MIIETGIKFWHRGHGYRSRILNTYLLVPLVKYDVSIPSIIQHPYLASRAIGEIIYIHQEADGDHYELSNQSSWVEGVNYYVSYGGINDGEETEPKL
jgi:hypothetical protein